jgi:hypothetical protein
MPNGAWPTSVVANSIDLTRSDGRILLRLVRGLNEVPSVRGGDTIVPSLAGRVPRSRVYDRLMLEAAGYIFGAGTTEDDQRESYRDTIDELRGLMDPTQDPYSVVATLEDGTTTRTFTARPLNMVVTEHRRIPSVAEVSLEWECVDADDFYGAGS